jgi:hypothetical protein
MTICRLVAAGAGYSALPAKDHTPVTIPDGFKIKLLPTKRAAGTRKPMSGAVNAKSRSANTGGGGAKPTSAVSGPDRRALTNLAARGW